MSNKLLQPLNFSATWEAYTRQNMVSRYSDAAERAFWRDHAVGYDRANSMDNPAHQQTVRAIQSYLHPDDSLLDVGAGAGRFTLPLAPCVQSVTALDLSPDMLALLKQHAHAQTMTNIETVCGNWEQTPVAAHDVVVAAWSLYRQHDIRTSLQKLMATTRRTLIIVDGDYAARPDDDPPHERLKAEIWGAGDPGLCNYLYFAGMLRQCRARAEVRLVYEQMSQTAPSEIALAQTFAPSEATPAEVATYARRLRPYLHPTSDGCCYTCRFAVGLVIWHNDQFH